jgi:hypothetical protein
MVCLQSPPTASQPKAPNRSFIPLQRIKKSLSPRPDQLARYPGCCPGYADRFHAASYGAVPGFFNLSTTCSSVLLRPAIFRRVALLGLSSSGFSSPHLVPTARRRRHALLTFFLPVGHVPLLEKEHLQARSSDNLG